MSNGMGSSGFVELLRSGRNGLYGLGCSRSAGARVGASIVNAVNLRRFEEV